MVPAADRITTVIRSTTPVLIELSVCQVFRVQRMDATAMAAPFSLAAKSNYAAIVRDTRKRRKIRGLQNFPASDGGPGMGQIPQDKGGFRCFHAITRACALGHEALCCGYLSSGAWDELNVSSPKDVCSPCQLGNRRFPVEFLIHDDLGHFTNGAAGEGPKGGRRLSRPSREDERSVRTNICKAEVYRER